MEGRGKVGDLADADGCVERMAVGKMWMARMWMERMWMERMTVEDWL